LNNKLHKKVTFKTKPNINRKKKETFKTKQQDNITITKHKKIKEQKTLKKNNNIILAILTSTLNIIYDLDKYRHYCCKNTILE
jgi:hypothetical protein